MSPPSSQNPAMSISYSTQIGSSLILVTPTSNVTSQPISVMNECRPHRNVDWVNYRTLVGLEAKKVTVDKLHEPSMVKQASSSSEWVHSIYGVGNNSISKKSDLILGESTTKCKCGVL